MMGIYKITNIITGEFYIGQTNDIKRRWKEHRVKMKTNTTKTLYAAMREYGIDNFTFEVLEECEEKDLLDREQYYIEKYKAMDYGYNMRKDDNFHREVNEKITNAIKEDLKNLSLTQNEIAKKYNVSHTLVCLINSGKTRYDSTISYPIRQQIDNTKKEHYCVDCGKEIGQKGVRCPVCASKALRKVERPTREELKQLIRNNSFSALGRQFNVSDNAIRKWCKYYSLPSTKKEINFYSDKDWELV